MELEQEIQQTHFKNGYQKAGINLIYTSSWLSQRQIPFFRPYGITPQQFNILRILRGQHPKPATVKLLKERMLDKMSDVSRLVEKLRVKGLAERAICHNNRRTVDIFITEKGLDILSKIDLHQKQMDNLLSNLNEDEIHLLNNLLDKLRG